MKGIGTTITLPLCFYQASYKAPKRKIRERAWAPSKFPKFSTTDAIFRISVTKSNRIDLLGEKLATFKAKMVTPVQVFAECSCIKSNWSCSSFSDCLVVENTMDAAAGVTGER